MVVLQNPSPKIFLIPVLLSSLILYCSERLHHWHVEVDLDNMLQVALEQYSLRYHGNSGEIVSSIPTHVRS
jgi:hypothetical protein